METITDKELVARCRSGSKTAFHKLVERYYQPAYTMAYYYTHNRETALDISQETFVRIYKNLGKLDPNRPFKAWLFTIVKNLSLNYLSRHKKRRLLFSDYLSNGKELPTRGNNPAKKLERQEKTEMVWHALRRLKESDRDIILLKDFEDYSYQEISEILDIPLGTVMSRLYYARKKLSEFLEDETNG